jgi:hypothetical protein
MAEIFRKDVPMQAPDFFVTNKSGVTAVKRIGTTVEKVAVACYDVSGGDSGAIGAHALGVYIPAKAIILDAWIDVVTTFTDGVDDSATIAASIQSAGDLVAAIAIADTSNVWDAGVRGTLRTAPNLGADAAHDSALEVIALIAATKLKTTAVREITVTSAVAALTAGKMNIFVKYVISD